MYGKLKDRYDIRLLAPCSRLDAPVRSHADMLVGMEGGHIIVTRSYFDENKSLFCGLDPVVTDEEHGGRYPRDVLLNFIDTKTAVIGYGKAITACVNKPVINVKQGYARCSTFVGRDFAVSADAGILSALSALGYDTLRISAGGVKLPGYDHGFIGGASFADGGDVYFFGSLSHHKDGERIREFLAAHGAEVCELSDAPLLDLGGAAIV
jgi:hypothetical protein